MTKDFFTVSEDGEFVECSLTETSKNNQGGHKQSDQDYSQNRMCGGEVVQIFKTIRQEEVCFLRVVVGLYNLLRSLQMVHCKSIV